MTTGVPDEDRVANLELINSEITGRLSRQIDSGSRLDTKAVVLAGFAATAAQFLAVRHPQPLLAGFAFAAYGAAFALAAATFALRTYGDVPEPRGLLDGYVARPKEKTLGALAARRVAIFEENAKKHERKAKLWRWSLVCLSLGLALSVAAILDTGHHDNPGQPGRAGATASP